jgi:hypothetical protein
MEKLYHIPGSLSHYRWKVAKGISCISRENLKQFVLLTYRKNSQEAVECRLFYIDKDDINTWETSYWGISLDKNFDVGSIAYKKSKFCFSPLVIEMWEIAKFKLAFPEDNNILKLELGI